MENRLSCKVYYEDTDCLGMVYHANYLKYMERGRSEFVDALGKPIGEWNRNGYNFVVYTMNIRFRKAANLGDNLDVVTRFRLTTPFRGLFQQRVERSGEVIIEADVEVVCLDATLRIREFPEVFGAFEVEPTQ